jgi:hypothetical protein
MLMEVTHLVITALYEVIKPKMIWARLVEVIDASISTKSPSRRSIRIPPAAEKLLLTKFQNLGS